MMFCIFLIKTIILSMRLRHLEMCHQLIVTYLTSVKQSSKLSITLTTLQLQIKISLNKTIMLYNHIRQRFLTTYNVQLALYRLFILCFSKFYNGSGNYSFGNLFQFQFYQITEFVICFLSIELLQVEWVSLLKKLVDGYYAEDSLKATQAISCDTTNGSPVNYSVICM